MLVVCLVSDVDAYPDPNVDTDASEEFQPKKTHYMFGSSKRLGDKEAAPNLESGLSRSLRQSWGGCSGVANNVSESKVPEHTSRPTEGERVILADIGNNLFFEIQYPVLDKSRKEYSQIIELADAKYR